MSQPYTMRQVLIRLTPALILGGAFGASAGLLGGDHGLTIVALAGAIAIPIGLIIVGPWMVSSRVRMVCPTTGSVHCAALTMQILAWAFETGEPKDPVERLVLLYFAQHAAQEDTAGTLHRIAVDHRAVADWARVDVAAVAQAIDGLSVRGLVSTVTARETDSGPAYYLTRAKDYTRR